MQAQSSKTGFGGNGVKKKKFARQTSVSGQFLHMGDAYLQLLLLYTYFTRLLHLVCSQRACYSALYYVHVLYIDIIIYVSLFA